MACLVLSSQCLMDDYLVPGGHRGLAGAFMWSGSCGQSVRTDYPAEGNFDVCRQHHVRREQSEKRETSRTSVLVEVFTSWVKSLWDFRLDGISSLAFDVCSKWDHSVSGLILTWGVWSFTVHYSCHRHKSSEVGPFAASSLYKEAWRSPVVCPGRRSWLSGWAGTWTKFCLIPKLTLSCSWKWVLALDECNAYCFLI